MKVAIREERVSSIKRAFALFTMLMYVSCMAPVVYANSGNENKENSKNTAVSASLISAEEGGEIHLGKASIIIPPGALDKDTEISITRLRRVHETGESIDNATASGGGYRFLPAGQQFLKEVKITIPYDRSLNLRESALEDAATYFFDTKAGKWTRLKRLEVNRPEATITSASTHFTDMINATLSLPDTSAPLELNINSIKGLEAADPLSGIIVMNAPQGNAGGDASFSFPLQVPAGRSGMQPKIAVAYSSGGGNGIVGKGFSLSAGSSITTDTRTGLPEYDGHDVYLKDGSELALYDEYGQEQEYTVLSEGAFERIQRHETDGDDWWEITSKDGSRHLYGMRSGGRIDTDSRSGYMHEGRYSTYTWNLTEEKDIYGNSISYYYNNDGSIPYLTEIKYTGTDGEGGAYSVRLSYESRRDIILDARGRFLTSQRKRLASIESVSRDTVLRKYELGYGEGISGSSILSSFTVRNGDGQSYTYRFDYHGLEKDAQGRDIYFADAEEWENGRAISEGVNTGTGISTYGSGGIGIGSDSADVHVSGSINANSSGGTGWTESTLADFDGDGRPDAVTQSGNILYIYKNTGKGFESSPVTVNAESPHIDLEDSGTSGFGWSATGGFGAKSKHIGADAKVSVAESSHNGTTGYTCMPCDVDGDGRTDILITGRDTYLRNTGTGGNISFAPARLSILGKIRNAHRSLTEKELKGYRESFYEQTPFRAWKAPYSGTIYIEENALRTDTNPHEGTVYARTYAGSSTSDEAELRLDLRKDGLQSSSGKIKIGQGDYAWLVLDTGGDPEGTDCEWDADIRYSSVQPFGSKEGLPVPTGKDGKFIPGRITEAQMKSLVAELAPVIKAKVSGSSTAGQEKSPEETESSFWQRLASLYTYDGISHEFVARKGIGSEFAGIALEEFFSGSVADVIMNDSIKKLSLFGIEPEWEGNGIVYKREGRIPASHDSQTGVTTLGEIGGKSITVKGGKVYEDDRESTSYTAAVSAGKTVLIGNGFRLECEGTSGTIIYNTDSYYKADENGCILIPEFSSEGISFRKVNIGTWNSRSGYSSDDMSGNYILYSDGNGTVEVQASSPLYGGSGNWYYGIWKGSLTDNPFDGSVISGIYDVQNINSEKLKEELSPSEDEDGKQSYDYEDLKAKARSNMSRWYRPFLHGESVAGTESVSPVQDMDGAGNLSSHTEYSRPYLTASAVHAERAGGKAYYNIEGIRKNPSSDGSMTIPLIRKTATSGTDLTMSGGIGISGFTDPDVVSGSAGNSGGINTGINESDAEILQSVQDVTGDGIPDIVRQSGGVLEVIKGSRERDSWDVTFDAENPVTISADKVSHSHTSVVTQGATVSASGSVTVIVGKSVKSTKIYQNASVSAGLDGGISVSEGMTEEDVGFLDINGDGIADLFEGGSIRLGLGDSHTEKVSYFSGLSVLSRSRSLTNGLNYSMGSGGSGSDAISENLSLSSGLSGGIGANVSMSASYSTQTMTDINGDGLADIVGCDGSDYTVRYNMGDSFSEVHRIAVPSWGGLTTGEGGSPLGSWDEGIDVIGGLLSKASFTNSPSYSESPDWTLTKTVSVSGNIGASIDLSIPIGTGDVFFHINGGIGGSIDASASVTESQVRMTDLDGDGLADQVLTTGSGMWWKRNLAGTADLISKVYYPWGGTCSINYDLVLGTVDSPHSRLCMTECILDDGCEGITEGYHSVRTRYSYSDAYFERLHKDSYGYGTVELFRNDESCIRTEYANSEFYSRYIPIHTLSYGNRTSGGTAELLAESRVTLRPSPYAQPASEESVQYGSSGAMSSVRTEYMYGEYGNATHIIQSQLKNGTADDSMTLVADIDWDDTKAGYLHSLPVSIEVMDGGGSLLRKRTGTYDDYGALTSLSQYYRDGEAAEYSYTYDEWGNMLSASDGLGIRTEYGYDKVLHQYPLNTVHSGGGFSYTSSASWNYTTGTRETETDINGNTMRYTYDAWQRTVSVRSPYDTGSVPAIGYSYGTDGAGRWYSVTDNKVSFNPSDHKVVKTVIQSDGLGRTLRTAKTGEVWDRSSDVKRTGWNVSGATGYDADGRVVSMGQPYFIEGGLSALALSSGVFSVPSLRPTLCEYDGLDRVIRTELPDGSVQTSEYDVTDSGEPYTRTTDSLGNISVQRCDPAGNIIFVERLDSSGTSLTSAEYKYNAIGEMLCASDAAGNEIKASYDMLGRKVVISSADGGSREFKYNAYSLLEETTPNLRKNGHWIGYSYDGLNRLVKVDYPETADTIYTYGNSGASDNSAGKVTQVTDASGTISYRYGKLGETTEEKRTLSVRNGTTGEKMTASMGYQSNYLGQMERITYPDGETVDYGYDAGGQVCSVTGHHYGHDYFFVADIGYDEFGQRTCIRYGNGVRTDYEYDENRRWLKSIETANNVSRFQNIKYSFDSVGNVLGYENDCMGRGGYTVSQKYAYDSLYQLTSVHGETTYNPHPGGLPEHVSVYDQSFAFDVIGNMTEKVSREKIDYAGRIGKDDLNYSLDYTYAKGYAHRPDHINDIYYQYDLDGNLIMTHRNPIPGQDGGSQEEESPVTVPGDDFWDDDWENGGTSGVIYGESSGNASSGDNWDDFWDDDWENGGTSGVIYGANSGNASSGDNWDDFWDDDWENGGTSGVIYGGSSLNNGSGNAKPDTQIIAKYTWDERDRLISSVMNDCDAWYIYGEDGQRTNKWTQDEETLYFNRMWTWHDGNTNDDQTAKHIYLGSERIVSQMNSWKGQQTYSEESHKTYYYHSDHLGSAQLITDYRGEEYQRTEYTPYGEEWVDKFQSENYVDIPYRFTGKERDEETGLYYYGARYLDPKTSVWISTDPALGDYIPEAGKDNSQLPGMGGVFNLINGNLYCYGGNNPVRYVDPDGKIITNSGNIYMQSSLSLLGNSTTEKISEYGCTLTSYTRMAIALGANVTLDDANSMAMNNGLYTKGNLLTPENGAALVNALLVANNIVDTLISYDSSAYDETSGFNLYSQNESSDTEYFVNARINTTNADSTSLYEHTVSVDANALTSDRCDGYPTNMRIRDTSNVGRDQLRGDSSNRVNNLLRIDFFKINRTLSQSSEED